MYMQIKSESLAKVISKQLQGYFSDEYIRLITCFLNKDLVQKHPELDTCLDLYGSQFKSIDSIHIKSVDYEEKQVDPVYKFFFSNNPGLVLSSSLFVLSIIHQILVRSKFVMHQQVWQLLLQLVQIKLHICGIIFSHLMNLQELMLLDFWYEFVQF